MKANVCTGGKSIFKDHFRWPFLNTLIAASLGGCLVGLNNVFLYYLLSLVKSDLGIDKNKIFESDIFFLSYLVRTIGVVMAIWTMDSIGRRNTICWAAVMLELGAGLSILFPWKQTVIVGRCIVVVAAGVSDITIPVYISEITPYHVRGMIMTFQIIPEAIGQVLGLFVKAVIKKVRGNWKNFVLVEIIICIAYIYAMFSASETPRFLYRQAHLDMDVSKYNEAVELVRRICPAQDAEHELHSLQSGIEDEIEERGSLDGMNQNPFSKALSAWREQATRNALLPWLLCTSLPKLCGINVVIYLTSSFTKARGISHEWSDLHRSIILCCLKMMGSAMGACFLDIYEVTRTEVLQVSFVGMIAAHGAISVLLYGKTDQCFLHGAMILAAVILCVGSFYIGQGVAATITEEACPFRFRGISAGAVLINSFICNHIIAEFSHLILRTLNLTALFIALFIWNLVLLVLMWRYVPKISAMPLELVWITLKNLTRSKG